MDNTQLVNAMQELKIAFAQLNEKINQLGKHIEAPIKVEFPYRAPGYEVRCPTCDNLLYKTYADYQRRRNRPENLPDEDKIARCDKCEQLLDWREE